MQLMRKVPVLVMGFNRPDHVKKALKPVCAYQPDRLYLACDGPRADKEGEPEIVESTQKAMLDAVNWECDVRTFFRKENLGCTDAVNSAISWFFEHEDYGVIIEDDIVLSVDFFKMCEVLLPKYKDEDQIMHINSHNYKARLTKSNEYVFSYFAKVWGWATWKRAWEKNTKDFNGWGCFPKYSLIKRYGLFQGLITIWHYYKCSNMNSVFGSWDYTWSYHIEKNNGIVISPKVHLSQNIGIGTTESTNYSENSEDYYSKSHVG